MAATLDELLPAIKKNGDAGLSIATITTKFVGKSKAKERTDALREKLADLIRGGAVWGPFKFRQSQLYFADGRGPSIETAGKALAGLVSRSGVKLISKPTLEKKLTGMNGRFFADGLKHAIAEQLIVELSCGNSKYYLHREVAADYFGFATTPSDNPIDVPRPIPAGPGPAAPTLTLESLLPAYRRLKAQQGGFSAVNIFDLLQASKTSKDELHRLLTEETKAGRVTIHPSTSVDLPREVIDAGIRLDGFPEPFVSVVVKSEP